MRLKEENEALEYLYKYIRFESFGERSLDKDISTVLQYVKKLETRLESIKCLIDFVSSFRKE